MKVSNTSERLKEYMSKTGSKQVDILNKCKPYCEKYNVKLNKNDLSQYVSGKVVPKQDKLSILGMALGVSETWLMGYDTPEESASLYSSKQQQLLENFDKLNARGKDRVIEYAEDLSFNDKYKKDTGSQQDAAG